MKKYKSKILIAAMLLAIPSATFASYSVQPVNVKISSKTRMASLQVRNNYEEEKNFQVVVLQKKMEGGKVVYKETKDLVVSPGIAKIGPKRTQLIRIASRGDAVLDGDNYKLSIKELASYGKVAVGNGVQLVTQFMIPVNTVTD